METWKEFDANELTHSAAHHLLAIHDVGEPYGGWARVSDIARALNITRGSVSITLRVLKKRGWVETDAHRLVKLSPAGLQIAHSVKAKRAVVKAFLTSALGLPEAQAEIDSCKIEHLISDQTGQRLIQLMQFLTCDSSAAMERLTFFQREPGPCPTTGTCEVCKGHCLMTDLERAV
ncbi:MAG: metal-dependent transcriptional regulator [Acidobacteria bacterium]|nr:metal-dependent transcriptional regulator [Acidobacteriota bacterium]